MFNNKNKVYPIDFSLYMIYLNMKKLTVVSAFYIKIMKNIMKNIMDMVCIYQKTKFNLGTTTSLD